MALPHELVARHVAPYFKALVAVLLSERGMGQERIARLMGVTQPMVSRYLRWGRGYALERLREAGVAELEALAVAEAAAAALERGDVERYVEIATTFFNHLLAEGLLCGLHRRGAPALRNCSVCSRIFSRAVDPLVEEVREAAEMLASTPGAHILIPRVGSNVVAARPGARSIGDVVGFTGGLFRAGNRVAVVGDPVYGGSRHTASVLLIAHRRWPAIRAAVVAAYREDCVEALAAAGEVARAGPHRGPGELMRDLREAVEALQEAPVALVSLGGMNLEPVIYVFGSSAPAAVRLLIERCLPGAAAGD